MSQITSLGKYHILENLAADWMSDIYRVKTVGIAGFEKVQVLRRVHAEHSRDPAFFRSFIEEAKVAFSLNHRNIVQVFEFGKTGEDLFLAMEHITGLNLAVILDRARGAARPLPAGLTCYLMGEVASGLEYAHAKTDHHGSGLGVVHCLLTPANVACSFEGSVKILDFGISRTAWFMAPQGEQFPGNPRYLSPEQLQGQTPDPRSDLFSFGVILWEMLTGIPLFQETSMAVLRRQVLQEQIPSPRTLAPEIPEGLEALTMACLERDPARRGPGARQLQAELFKTQRQLGAVIGSRALSTFLEDLFPQRTDTQDARQALTGSSPALAPLGAETSPAPRDNSFEGLFLDRPGTLFPDEDDDLSGGDHPVPAPVPPSTPPLGPAAADPAFHPGTAGVLRTGRPVDEEASAVYPRWAQENESSAVRVLGSDELHTDGMGGGDITADFQDEDISIIDLGEGELEEDGTLTPGEPDPWEVPEASTEDMLDQWGSPEHDLPPPQLNPSWQTQALHQPGATTSGEEQPESRRGSTANLDHLDDQSSPPTPALHRAATADIPRHPLANEETALIPTDRSETLEVTAVGPTDEAGAVNPVQTGGETREVTPVQMDGDTLSEHDTAPVQGRPVDPENGLPQKKRFIAVCLLMDGPPEALAQAGALISDIAYKMEGLIHEQGEGRAVVLFGLPTANELDIVSAVRFAMDCREAAEHLPRLDHDADEGLTVRIGLRAGTAHSSNRAAWRHGYQLLGNILQVTEELTALGHDGHILLEGLAARLALGHYLLSPEEVGAGRECHRLMGPRPAQGQRQSLPGSLLVGREVEIRAIKSAWRECLLQGQQRCALLVGEAGIGKTRLVDHFLGYFARDVQLLTARATPHRRGTPGTALVDLLHTATGMRRGSGSSKRGDLSSSLAHLLGETGGDDHTAETLLSLVPGGPGQTRESFVLPDEAVTPFRLHRAMRKLLNRLAWDSPVAVIIEDLHWADSTSLDCITALVEGAAEAAGPILFLITSRTEEGPLMQALAHAEGVTPVLMDELDEPDRQRLIVAGLGQDRAGDEALIQEIARRAGGNPFYIRELTQAVSELEAEEITEVPPTVQRVIAGRVDRLPLQVKVVLQHAAVIGPAFREPVLARFLGRNPARALGSLRSRGIIVPGHLQSQADQYEREWTFRNMLLREVIYQDLGLATRRRLHLRVGEILADRAERGASDPPAEAAYHLELGGQGLRAATYYLQAADASSAALASPDSLRLYEQVLRLGQEDPDLCYAAHAGREHVYRQLGWAGQQAEELQALGDLVGTNQARVADLRNREAAHLLRGGEAYLALAAAEQGEEAALECGEVGVRAESLRLKGEAYHRINDHQRAEDAVQQALDLFASQDATRDQVRTLATLGRLSLGQARYDQALEHFVAAQELLQGGGDRWLERILHTFQAVVHTCRGHYPQALGEAFYALKLCEEYGDRAREGDNSTVVGIIHLELGMHDQAAAYLEEALAIHRETGSRWSEADTLVYLGLLEAARGQFGEAEVRLAAARDTAEAISAQSITIAAQCASAWMLCERGDPGDGALAAEEGLAAAEGGRLLGLVVSEIPGLSRAARGYAAAGRYPEAMSLSRRAVELLGDQLVIEGPEEEIFFNHYRILEAMGDAAADRWLARARQTLEAKLGRLDNPDWRQAYTTQVALNRAILAPGSSSR